MVVVILEELSFSCSDTLDVKNSFLQIWLHIFSNVCVASNQLFVCVNIAHPSRCTVAILWMDLSM